MPKGLRPQLQAALLVDARPKVAPVEAVIKLTSGEPVPSRSIADYSAPSPESFGPTAAGLSALRSLLQ